MQPDVTTDPIVFGEWISEMPSEWRDGASVFQSRAWLHASLASRPPRRFLGLRFRDAIGAQGWAALESCGPGCWRPTGASGADFLDAVAAPGRESEVAAAYGAYWRSRSDWRWIDLPQVRPGSVIERIPGIAAVEGETCPTLALPSDWESFRKSLGKSLRGNIGYYARALSKVGAVLVRTATAETLDEDMDAFFALHQSRWRARWMPGAFADARTRTFHRDLARRLIDSDRLRLHTLRIDDRPVAAIHCMVGGSETAYYLGGFDPEYARWSPGTVLTAHAIRMAIERDRSERFEFLRGNERYKYKWGALDRSNRRFALVRGPIGHGLRALGTGLLGFELALKQRMHGLHGGAGAGPRTSGREEHGPSAGNERVTEATDAVSGRNLAATAGKGARR
ncbi:MAG: GNAT family N-acetyltransferase [Armatimonadota bacterium]